MRKGILSFAMLLLATTVATESFAQVPARRGRVDDIESMLDRGRWGEARLALDSYSRGLDPHRDVREVEWAEYHKVRCAVELGAADAEIMMEEFIKRYPTSVYRNSILFMMACYVYDYGDIKSAKEFFNQVDYRGLGSIEKERFDIRVGIIRFNDGKDAIAERHFRKIPKVSKYYSHALYYRAYLAYKHDRVAEAIVAFRELKDHDVYGDLVPYYLLQIEYRSGNYDKVITEGQQLLKRASKNTYYDLVRVIAESYFVKEDYANALRFMADYPQDRCGRQENYIKGYSYYRLARYDDAIDPLTAVCGAQDALTQNAAFHLGDCYLRIADKKQAAEAFGMASVQGFDEKIAEDAMLNYCRLMFELGGGHFNESINILKDYLTRYPDSVYEQEIKQLLVAAYYNSKDYDAAYEAIHSFRNPDRELKSALQKIAVFRAVEAVKREDWDLASKLLEESEKIGLVPKYNALTLYWQGEVLFHLGEVARAAEKYDDYVRRAPRSEIEYHYANYGKGYSYFQLDLMEESVLSFEEFVQIYPKRDRYLYDAYNRLGDAYFSMREFNEARRVYKISSLSSYDEHHYANYQLAMVDGIENKNTSKVDRLKSIVTMGEGDYVDDAWYELGRTFLAMERYADGAATLQDFVDADALSPYHVSALSDLALAYYNTGRKDDARRCYERVVAIDPQSSSAMEAMRGIREIYVSEGNIDDYFAYAERSGVQSDMSIAARDSLTFASSKTLYLDGEIELAARKLTEYLENFKNGYNCTEALFYLSDCYVTLNNNAEALYTMEKLIDSGNTPYTERVLDVYARMSFDEGLYPQSAEAYLKLYNVAHEEKRRKVAAEGYVEAMLKHASDEAIIEMAELVERMSSASPQTQRQALMAKADVLRKSGSRQEAMKIYSAIASRPSTVEGAEAYYRLVEDNYLSGDYISAEQRVYALGECGSMYWQAKMFLVLGDVLAKNGNTFQARATYQSVVDGYTPKDDGIIEEAKERIAALGQ